MRKETCITWQKTTCIVCHTVFAASRNGQQYCSQKCRTKLWRDLHRDSYNAAQRKSRASKPPTERTCPVCGSKFVCKSRRKFCSNKCRDKNKRANPIEKEKQRTRQQKWRASNIERNRHYQRNYMPDYTRRQLAIRPWHSVFKGTKSRAKTLGIAFNLDEAWMASRWTGSCELTALPFSEMTERKGYKNTHFSPSIDRISPTKGYTKNNCRIVLWAVNSFKRDGTDEEMYRIARALMDHAPPEYRP
jgi:predicted nucleic acid-binding Zn ribbon protein